MHIRDWPSSRGCGIRHSQGVPSFVHLVRLPFAQGRQVVGRHSSHTTCLLLARRNGAHCPEEWRACPGRDEALCERCVRVAYVYRPDQLRNFGRFLKAHKALLHLKTASRDCRDCVPGLSPEAEPARNWGRGGNLQSLAERYGRRRPFQAVLLDSLSGVPGGTVGACRRARKALNFDVERPAKGLRVSSSTWTPFVDALLQTLGGSVSCGGW